MLKKLRSYFTIATKIDNIYLIGKIVLNNREIECVSQYIYLGNAGPRRERGDIVSHALEHYPGAKLVFAPITGVSPGKYNKDTRLGENGMEILPRCENLQQRSLVETVIQQWIVNNKKINFNKASKVVTPWLVTVIHIINTIVY